MKKFRIACDLDGIVVDLHGPWMHHYREAYNDTITEKDIHSWEMVEVVKKECGSKIYDFLNTPFLFQHLSPYKGALEGLKALHDMGHDIIIITAPARSPESAADKIAWVRNHMPWLSRRKVMIGHQKHWLKADVFIDDSPENIKDYREEWPDAHILTVAWPFNKKVEPLVSLRAHGFQDHAAAWSQFVEYIKDV